MSYLGLLWTGLFRRRTRTILTLLSIAVAFLLFALLRSIVASLNGGLNVAGADRLITSPRYSIVDPMPISHLNRLRALSGVSAVTLSGWFGGQYKEPANFFPKYPVQPRDYFAMYTEYRLPRAQLEAFANTRTGAVASRALADRFNWKVGDRIPIQADIWPKKGGDRLWTFDLVGIFDVARGDTDPKAFLLNYDYFDEAREFSQGSAGWFIVRIANPPRASEIARAIDQLFANSGSETRTATEQEFQASFARQLGDIGLIMTGILGAVFFTILLLTGNTMAQAFRERIPEIAVLKTLGFSNGAILGLILGEAVLLSVLACALGIGGALLLTPVIGPVLSSFLPSFGIAAGTIAAAFSLAIALGVVTGLFPALQGMRLTIVAALRRG